MRSRIILQKRLVFSAEIRLGGIQMQNTISIVNENMICVIIYDVRLCNMYYRGHPKVNDFFL
jgi:hypothetical protein